MKKGIIIQGSSRSDGNTNKIVNRLAALTQFDIVDLKSKNIGYFDYAHQNADDDFIPLLKEIVKNYDILVFATPVYWYTMSAEMKTFFDRISDALKTEKDTGRQLRGKHMAAVSCGSDINLNPGFFEPFELSADYLGMPYLGCLQTWISSEVIEECVDKRIRTFAMQLTSEYKIEHA